jgi:uncharacterized protein (TIGR00288 family)
MPGRPHRGAPTRAPIAPIHQGPGASANHAVQGAPNAALLIDFDNVTLGIRSDLQTELRNLLSSAIVKGKVAVQRAYADWRRYPQYIVPLSESSIDLIFAPAYGSSKKNATDIRLAVDAIELVFTRPEIGTYILLSGDSDFSSLVLKLKEYGRYVIGVGIRESSSDLLVQNCDEYYSYNALAGLVKQSDEEIVRRDPWELVVEAVARMKTNGDVMRADRLKQVMQEIDPSFDESNLKIAKFSKFCLEAAQRGLLKVTKLDNGQLEVAPADDRGSAMPPATPSATPASSAAVAADRPEREGRGRRGRRGRGRDRGRDHAAEPAANVGTVASAAAAAIHGEAAARDNARPAESTDNIGRGGERLSRDEAFSLLRRAIAEVAGDDGPVPAQLLRERAYALLGRDSESLNERNFSRIIRDAHDASVLDVRKRGDSYEVSPAASAPPVKDQLGAQQAAAKPAAEATPAMRSITGRRSGRGKPGEIPASLLSVGVVELDIPAPVAPVAKPAKKKAAARRGGRAKKVAKK